MMFSSEQIFNINGCDDNALNEVLNLAKKLSDNPQIKAFRKGPKGLVFYYTDRSTRGDIQKYPFPATNPVIIEQIKDYIKNLSREEIKMLAGPCPDIDGSVELGWEVFCPLWYGKNEIEEHDWGEFLAVRPSWIVFAK